VNSDFEWQFGGWLRDVPPAVAWSILGVAALGGLALIVFLYRRTLRRVSEGSRVALTAFRVALLLVVCLLLANPSHVRRPGDDNKKNERHLAVIVDRSASMDSVDNRNETRLQNAVKIWKLHVDEAAKAFDQVDHYRFASRLEKVGSLDEALHPGAPGPETQLWAALHEAMQDSPAGIVCITDGLDTSGKDAGEVIGEAQTRGIPLYFVPALNRSRPTDLICIRDVKTPSKVLRLSKFNASAIMEISTPHDRDVPVELWSGSKKLASATLSARAGWNVLPWSQEVTAGEPGAMPLEFRLGEGDAQETAASTTQVVDHTSVEVLYYQGALQWGYRFLRAALESDQSFRLTSILNPALGVKISAPGGTTLDDLPDTAEGLKRFQIVILAHVLADQLTANQQQALVDYAKGGGGVLFIAPDSQATQRFAGTPLEAMLPVVFERTDEPTLQQKDEIAFLARMRAAFEGNAQDSATADGEGSDQAPQLVPFQVPPGVTSVLKSDQPKPLFSNYARVLRAKPAAEILAVHPTERTAEDAPRILMARQQFGAGFTVAMATDLLWRWKMSLPSDSRAPEIFWQQLMLSLVPASEEGLRIVKSSSTAAVNRAASLLVQGAPGDEPPRIEAVSPSGQRQTLVAASSPDGWQATLTPDAQGRWQVIATGTEGDVATMSLPVEAQIRTQENSNAPPDVDGMRRIADATGGALIESDPVFRPESAAPMAGAEVKTAEPIWNQSWLLGVLLGLYAVELIARRVFRLL
jgi:hypothetical protein